MLVKAAGVIDNPWALGCDRAAKAVRYSALHTCVHIVLTYPRRRRAVSQGRLMADALLVLRALR